MIEDQSLNFPSDPKQIEKICKKFGITEYHIGEGGIVDVDGDVNLIEKKLKTFPIRFGIVSGHFWCWDNDLISLEGAPNSVGGDFDCFSNENLASLVGSPRHVGGRFDCSYTPITDLIGAPDEVDGFFYCCSTKLKSLNGLPRLIGMGFSCQGSNKLVDPNGLRDLFLEDFFNCDETPIQNLMSIFDSYDEFRYSLDYNYVRISEDGPTIVKWKLEEALREINIDCPDSIEGYILE